MNLMTHYQPGYMYPALSNETELSSFPVKHPHIVPAGISATTEWKVRKWTQEAEVSKLVTSLTTMSTYIVFNYT